MQYDSLAPASNGDRVPDVAYATTMQREVGERIIFVHNSTCSLSKCAYTNNRCNHAWIYTLLIVKYR